MNKNLITHAGRDIVQHFSNSNIYSIVLKNDCASMSNSKNRTDSKPQNPLHSSFILSRPSLSSAGKQEDPLLKLSHFYTKATSEFQYSNDHHHEQTVAQYQTRIKNLQSGYERSREQYESSIKNMYKQKIVLLNIISHNQALVNEFRSKLKLQSSSFKEIETKYNILTSGLFHNQLCPNCILSITNADFQCKTPQKDKETPRSGVTVEKKVKRRLGYTKQYSWMYTPNLENSISVKLKTEIVKLKLNIEDISQEHARKIYEKSRQIENLRAEITRLTKQLASPIHKIIVLGSKDDKAQQVSEKQTKARQKMIKHLEEELASMQIQKDRFEMLFKEANEKIVAVELERLNAKYRNKFF